MKTASARQEGRRENRRQQEAKEEAAGQGEVHHLRAAGICEEGAALGSALRAQDGQLQDIAGGSKQRPQVLLIGL